jgi:hypothetical protein
LIALIAVKRLFISGINSFIEILLNVNPNEILSVSIAGAIYDGAGKPQRQYSCSVLTDVRYRVRVEWCNAKLETCRVEMEGLGVIGHCTSHSYGRRIKQINGSFGRLTKGYKE